MNTTRPANGSPIADDRALGMDRAITRRDFVNGAAVGIAALATATAGAAAPSASTTGGKAPPTNYPPARMGMRGSHPGAFEAAHALRDGSLDPATAVDVGETYDLVIVGGGLSGLAAAHFFIKSVGRDVRVLILENHDDFGGHARRNEFRVDGRLLVTNGGVLEIESPDRYNRWARSVLDDLGVDLHRYEQANSANYKLYDTLGLRSGHFFDRETWRRDQLIVPPAASDMRGGPSPDAIARSPLSARAKADMLRLLAPDQPDYLAGRSIAEKKALLAKTSYRDYLLEIVKIDPQAFWYFQGAGQGTFCVGADAYPALFGWVQGYPGFSGLQLGPIPDGLFESLPGGHHGRQKESGSSVHFPDGSATLARLLVGSLVPGATKARTQEDLGTGLIDYGALDRPDQPVRIRLSSTVLNVRHEGSPAAATECIVTYARSNDAEAKGLQRVRARNVIMACWNMFIPYLVPELPSLQREALAYGVKGPLVYTNVALRNWRAFQKLGIQRVSSQTMFFQDVSLAECVGIGEVVPPTSPDEPIVVAMNKYMAAPGLPTKRDQHRAGRAELLAISFEEFERQARSQLARILGPGGFDPGRDIAGITVNRWPHGYAYTYNSLYDPVEWVFSEAPDRPCVVARQPFGLISIANSDAAASPHTDAAFEEAHRAVGEVIAQRTFPFARRA